MRTKTETNEVVGSGLSAGATRVVLWIVLVASGALAAGTLVLGTGGAIADALSGRTTMTLVATGALPDDADAGPATIVAGGYETAVVELADLSSGTATLALVAVLIGILTQGVMAAAIAYLAWRLLRARPFLPALTNTITFGGGVLLIGSLLAQFLAGFASWMATDELNPSGDGAAFWPMVFEVDGTPMAMGLAFLLVGLAFGYGDRLSRDTDGLV